MFLVKIGLILAIAPAAYAVTVLWRNGGIIR